MTLDFTNLANNNSTDSVEVSPNSKKNSKRKKKSDDPLSEEQKQEIQHKVKLTMAKTVADIIDYRVKQWNEQNVEPNDIESKMKPTKEFIFGLSELIYDTAVILGKDLESFRKHHNKKTVMVEDFMLFCRRNPDMKQKMIQYYNSINTSLQ